MKSARILAAFAVCLIGAGGKDARQARVELEIDVPAPGKAQCVRLWIPYAMSDDKQDIADVRLSGNYSAFGVYRSPKFGIAILYAEWKGEFEHRTLSYSFAVRRRAVEIDNAPGGDVGAQGEEYDRYLEATSLGPVAGRVRETAEAVTKGKGTVMEKARAIYDHVVDTMRRDPAVKGCGLGDVEKLLGGTCSGKCADISSVFVALLRAAGIPAREVFGIRIPAGSAADMTKAQHCWAEFHVPGQGWVSADPADVLKAILERKLTDEEARPLRDRYFGGLDENRIAFGSGRDVLLNPAQEGGPLNYFMYPYAEADGKPLNDDLYGWNLGYKVTSRE